jgi:hypothetical protein
MQFHVTDVIYYMVFILFTFRQDCANFGIESPEFSVVDEVESDLKRHENMWSLFDEFKTGNYSYVGIVAFVQISGTA